MLYNTILYKTTYYILYIIISVLQDSGCNCREAAQHPKLCRSSPCFQAISHLFTYHVVALRSGIMVKWAKANLQLQFHVKFRILYLQFCQLVANIRHCTWSRARKQLRPLRQRCHLGEQQWSMSLMVCDLICLFLHRRQYCQSSATDCHFVCKLTWNDLP